MQDEQNNPLNNQVPQDGNVAPQPQDVNASAPVADDQNVLNVEQPVAPAEAVDQAPVEPVAPEAPAAPVDQVAPAPEQPEAPATDASEQSDAGQDPVSGAL